MCKVTIIGSVFAELLWATKFSYCEIMRSTIISNKTDISYLKTSRVLFYTNHSIEGCVQQQINAAVEWIRQSHHVALPAKVLTQQFRSALPVSNQNSPRQNYHRYLPLFRCLGNTKLT